MALQFLYASAESSKGKYLTKASRPNRQKDYSLPIAVFRAYLDLTYSFPIDQNSWF